MSSVDEARRLEQDLLAPDSKAIGTRLEALEKEMDRQFNSAEELAKARHEEVLTALAVTHAALTVSHTAIAISHASIMKALLIRSRR